MMSSVKDKKLGGNRRKEFKANYSDVFKEKVNHNVYGRAEVCVLAWLNSHYERQRIIMWGPDRIPESKLINNFTDCIGDCLVFAAVTAAYCPYINDIFFTNMYIEPKSQEQVCSNPLFLLYKLEIIEKKKNQMTKIEH